MFTHQSDLIEHVGESWPVEMADLGLDVGHIVVDVSQSGLVVSRNFAAAQGVLARSAFPCLIKVSP